MESNEKVKVLIIKHDKNNNVTISREFNLATTEPATEGVVEDISELCKSMGMQEAH
jgi:hypothetical protein